MGSAFSEIGFTHSVKKAQALYGSRDAYHHFEQKSRNFEGLTQAAADFIAQRDSFYQATVSDTGWPYVQHRGGPTGFVKMLDSKTLGYADYRGNQQYLSVGNLLANNRVSLIFMDYVNRRRLKVWGRTRIVHANEAPDLLASLEVDTYRARVERGIVIEVEAFDWNCPQHITPRFADTDFDTHAESLQEKIAALQGEIARNSPVGVKRSSNSCNANGHGSWTIG